ncbi:hypothetical protein M1N23_03260, partial [Dehalococcoidia bacterium]|nr:hypothetical protein [Dehalococcoidia bacterium]
GNTKKGIPGLAYEIPEDHDETDIEGAYQLVNGGGIPVGVIYRDTSRPTFDQRIDDVSQKASAKSVEKMLDSYAI